MKPLTVGNVVSAGLRIYRDRFLTYFRIAFLGYLWVIVPVYGWAKFAAMHGLIARMAFGEVTEKPETEKEARRQIKSRMWQFLVSSILVGLIVFFGFIGFYLVTGIIGFFIGSIIGIGEGSFNTGYFVLLGLVGILWFILLIVALTWLISRYLIVDLPIAVEDDMTAGVALGRSWNLTKGSVIRLQLIVFVAFLISLPIYLILQAITFGLQFLVSYLAASDNLIYDSLSSLFSILVLVISFAGGALLIPFWQSIKAVIYYDLRVRKEGLGLELE